jgi:hypothetical protein
MPARSARLGLIAAGIWLGLAGAALAGDDPDSWRAAVMAALAGEDHGAGAPGANGAGEDGRGGWRTSESVSPLTDATQFTAALASQAPLADHAGRETRAALVVRCLDGELAAFVVWPQGIDRDENGHTAVFLRLDHGTVQSAMWDTDERTGDVAGAFDNESALSLLARIGDARELVLRVPSASVLDAVFQLDGLAAVQAQAFAACHIGNTEDFGADLDGAPRLAERIDGGVLGLPDLHEAWVRGVRGDSIAEHAGLRKNDDIYEFDGHRIENVDQLQALIRATPTGKLVEVKVMRVQLIVGARPQTLHAQF